VKHLSGAPLKGRLLALPHKHWTRLERLDRDKHYSLLKEVVAYGCKKFKTLAPVDNLRKL
jgi:hypothetical protein